MKKFEGNHTCFECDKSFKWLKRQINRMTDGIYTVYSNDEIDVDITIIDKGKYEIVVICPHCKMKNKFEF